MPYLKRLIEDGLAHAARTGPGASLALVAHDDWCDLLHQRGPCNCTPDIEYVTAEEYARRVGLPAREYES